MAAPKKHVPVVPPRLQAEFFPSEHLGGLAPGGGELATGFGVGVQAATGEGFGDVVPARAGGDAEPVFVVHAEVQRFIETAELFINPPTPPHGGLAEKIAVSEAFGREGAGAFQPFFSRGFEEKEVGVDHIGVGIFLKGCADFFQRAGFVEVVGAKVGEDAAGGHREPFVDGVGLALVGLGDPADVRIRAEDGNGGVGRGGVDDEMLDRVPVRADRGDAIGKECSLVERRCDDGKNHRDFSERILAKISS